MDKEQNTAGNVEETFTAPDFDFSSLGADFIDTAVEEKVVEEPEKKVEASIADTELGTETEENKSEEKPSSKETNSSSHKSVSLALAKTLHEEGYLSDFDEENFDQKTGIDEVLKLWNEETNKRVQDYFADLDVEYKDFADAKASGVNMDQYKQIKSSEVQLSKITDDQIEDEDNAELRSNLLTTFYKETTQFTDARIEKLVKRLTDLGEDVEEAKSAKQELMTIRKTKSADLVKQANAQDETRKKDIKKRLDGIKTSVDSMKEIFPGVPLTTKDHQSLYKNLTEVVTTMEDPNTGGKIPMNAVMANRAKNPEKWDIVTAYLHQSGVFNFDKNGEWKPDFSKIQKTAKKKAISELESVLKSDMNIKGSAATTGQHTPNIESDLGDVTFVPPSRGRGNLIL